MKPDGCCPVGDTASSTGSYSTPTGVGPRPVGHLGGPFVQVERLESNSGRSPRRRHRRRPSWILSPPPSPDASYRSDFAHRPSRRSCAHASVGSEDPDKPQRRPQRPPRARVATGNNVTDVQAGLSGASNAPDRDGGTRQQRHDHSLPRSHAPMRASPDVQGVGVAHDRPGPGSWCQLDVQPRPIGNLSCSCSRPSGDVTRRVTHDGPFTTIPPGNPAVSEPHPPTLTSRRARVTVA